MPQLKIARLSPEDLEAIRAFEKTLEGNVCLVAVEPEEALYVLEAKMGPNDWRRVDRVYTEIGAAGAYFTDLDAARAAKSSLKGFLLSRKAFGIVKRPLRIRLSVPMVDEED
jgi:hypothetical protein